MNVCQLCFILSSAFIWKQGPFGLHHAVIIYFVCVVLLSILKALLVDLVQKSVAGRHPKLMLRRSESVVEKLLTNWLSLCLYKHLKVSSVHFRWHLHNLRAGGGGYAFYSISSLTIPVVWLVIVFVLADWWWPVFGGGVVFLPKFINLYYAVYAATAAFMTLAFTDGSWKKENEKKRSNNLLSTVLAMSTKQGSARSLKACMVLVDTALFANCSLANYC